MLLVVGGVSATIGFVCLVLYLVGVITIQALDAFIRTLPFYPDMVAGTNAFGSLLVQPAFFVSALIIFVLFLGHNTVLRPKVKSPRMRRELDVVASALFLTSVYVAPMVATVLGIIAMHTAIDISLAALVLLVLKLFLAAMGKIWAGVLPGLGGAVATDLYHRVTRPRFADATKETAMREANSCPNKSTG
jgi:hypothetical protein